MRTRWLFFLILLHCLTAAGAEVIVEPQMTTLVPTMQHLRDSCAIGGLYDACTRFVAFRLQATCAPENDSWRMHATARFRPWVFLRNMHSLPHEQEHVRDVKASVEGLVAGLEAATFDSRTGCHQRAFEEMAAFGELLRRFAAQSNAARHPLTRH